MGSRLSGWNLFPVDRYSKVAGLREELSPAQTRDLGFLILKVSETFPTGHAQKGYSEVKRDGASPQKGYSEIKRDGASPHVSDINLPYRPLR